MREMTTYERDCVARRILRELKLVARRHGVINLDATIKRKEDDTKVPAYNYLKVLLACDCGVTHPDDVLKKLIDRFYVQDWKFSDGLSINYRQARRALHHTFFGVGDDASLDERRNFIIETIFEVENQDKDAPNYRKGWENGTYRRTKEGQLLLAFAKYLADNMIVTTNDDDGEEAA